MSKTLSSILVLFALLFVSGCSNSADEGVETPAYSLSYDGGRTALSGTVAISLDSVTSGHTVVLDNFQASIEGCSVLVDSASFDPQSLTYSESQTLNYLSIDLSLLAACDASTMTLSAKRTETNEFDGQTFVYSGTFTMVLNISDPDPSGVTEATFLLDDDNITVSTGGESRPVSMQLFDQNAQPITEGTVGVIYPSLVHQGIDVGRFDATSADVEEGTAEFTYIAPADIEALIDRNITAVEFGFYYGDDTQRTGILTVNFATDGTSTTAYTVVLSPERLIVEEPLQSYTLSLQVFDAQNRPVETGSVEVIFPAAVQQGYDVGSFAKNRVELEEGKASFVYTAPEAISALIDDDIDDVTFTFIYDGASAYSASLQVEFSEAGSFTPRLVVSDRILTLTKEAEQRTVSVKVFDQNDNPVNSGNVSFIYPVGTYDAGTLTPSVAAIKDGVAEFKFVGPNSLSELNYATFYFYYEDDKTHTGYMRVYYNEQAEERYTPVLVEPTIELTKNSESRTVVVNVFDTNNAPAQEGTVGIIFPSEVLLNVEVGSFSPVVAEVSDGRATFTYTGPQDLQALIDAGRDGTSFEFYYGDDVTRTATLDVEYNPDDDQIVITSYDLLFQPQDGSLQMSLKELKPFTVTIVDENDVAVDPADVLDLNVTLENRTLGILMDSNGTEAYALDYTGRNNVTVSVRSYTKSGLVPIRVDARFTDVNGDVQTLSRVFNVVIMSGPPTAISFSYIGTEQDEDRAKFIEKFAISVTDKYFNPVNTNPSVSVGAIVGYASRVSAPVPFDELDPDNPYNPANYYYEDDRTTTLGELEPVAGQGVFHLNQSIPNAQIDLNNDMLATFGDGYVYEASGKWDIEDYNATEITLADQYDGNATSGLGFAVGNNRRVDSCKLGVEWVGQVQLEDDVTTLDEKGTAVIELTYDYYLTGKDIVLHANIIGQDNELDRELKIGEAQRRTLRGHGIEVFESTAMSAEDGETKIYRFYAWLKDTPEPYRNARFAFQGEQENGTGSILSGPTQRPVYECGNDDGHAYIEYVIEAAANESFSVILGDPVIVSEF